MEAQVTLRSVDRFFGTAKRASLHALGPIDLELRQGEFF